MLNPTLGNSPLNPPDFGGHQLLFASSRGSA